MRLVNHVKRYMELEMAIGLGKNIIRKIIQRMTTVKCDNRHLLIDATSSLFLIIMFLTLIGLALLGVPRDEILNVNSKEDLETDSGKMKVKLKNLMGRWNRLNLQQNMTNYLRQILRHSFLLFYYLPHFICLVLSILT